MSSFPITAQLAALAAGDFAALAQPAVRHAARRHLMDTTGAVIAGMAQPPARLAAEVHAGLVAPGPVAVPGLARGWDALSAAYLMGTAAHGLELDDGYTQGSVHPGTTVVPGLLAAMQLRPVRGERLVSAVAVGYELAARLAVGIHPASRRRGFHNTAVVGPLAVAGAVGTLYGFDAATIEQALGLAASSSAGLFAFLHSGGDVKRLHAGHAAREGLLAALMAEHGLRGPTGVLESRDGFVQAFGDPATSRLLQPAEQAEPAVTRCYIKPWACCRHLHPALDGLFDIQRATGLRAADVIRIEVDTYAVGAEHAHTGWGDMLSAQMSYPFALAVALVRGHADLADFGDAARAEPQVLALCGRVSVRVDAALDKQYPAARLARLRLTAGDGQVHERLVDDGYGSPANPISDEALAHKFDGLVAPVFGSGRAQALRAAFAALDSAADTSILAGLLGAA
ncbi:MAG: MmgE/PrpD family protein [Rubrivivax sp.]|nr:MmgE/PrpD family protein [Rubrivivax sp.]